MKKINIFAFAISILLLSSINAMEQGIAEFNQQFPVIRLSEEILTHIFDNNNDKTESLCNYIKFFLALRSTCKHFNEFLTVEQIGQFCTLFDQEVKNHTLKEVNIIEYRKSRFPSLILLYAKANPNVFSNYHPLLLNKALKNHDKFLTKIALEHGANPNQYDLRSTPPLFYAQKKELAELLIKYGVNIHVKNPINNKNILQHLINGYDHFRKKDKLDLFKFYIEKGVDPKACRPNDNTCLFHQLVDCSEYNCSINLEIAQILVNTIPDKINAVNIKGETALDNTIQKIKWYENRIKSRRNKKHITLSEQNLRNIITFLKKNDAKTAQELAMKTH